MGSYYQSCRWLRGEMKTAALVLISTLLSCTHGQNSVFSPPQGQRCRGRNYDGKRCCTPENPCQEGEGDCDGAGDGGVSDGNKGCKPGLVCGSNNCKKFGAYYHEKDDCCESEWPSADWGPWSSWRCVAPGTLRREQKCRSSRCSLNNGRLGSVNTQERYTNTDCV